jgi:hypothetical protein
VVRTGEDEGAREREEEEMKEYEEEDKRKMDRVMSTFPSEVSESTCVIKFPEFLETSHPDSPMMASGRILPILDFMAVLRTSWISAFFQRLAILGTVSG